MDPLEDVLIDACPEHECILHLMDSAKNNRVVKKYHLIAIGVGAFMIGFVILGEKFTAGIVAARVVDAIGDVLMDRGIAEL